MKFEFQIDSKIELIKKLYQKLIRFYSAESLINSTPDKDDEKEEAKIRCQESGQDGREAIATVVQR